MLGSRVHWPQARFCCSAFPLTKATGKPFILALCLQRGTRYHNLRLTERGQNVGALPRVRGGRLARRQMRGDRGSFCLPGAGLDLPSRPLAAVSAFLVEPACQTPAQLTKKTRDRFKMRRRKRLCAPPPLTQQSTTTYEGIPLARDLKTRLRVSTMKVKGSLGWVGQLERGSHGRKPHAPALAIHHREGSRRGGPFPREATDGNSVRGAPGPGPSHERQMR